jgi:hypothetical protein
MAKEKGFRIVDQTLQDHRYPGHVRIAVVQHGLAEVPLGIGEGGLF